MRSEFIEQTATIQATNRDQVKRLVEDHSKRATKLDEDHTKRIKKLEKDHLIHVETLQTDHRIEHGQDRGFLEEARGEIKKLKEEIEQLNIDIQTQGAECQRLINCEKYQRDKVQDLQGTISCLCNDCDHRDRQIDALKAEQAHLLETMELLLGKINEKQGTGGTQDPNEAGTMRRYGLEGSGQEVVEGGREDTTPEAVGETS